MNYIGKLDRDQMARLSFLLALLILLYRFFNDALLSQLDAPPLVFPDLDRTYWLLLWSGIPDAIVSHKILAILFDGALIFSCILSAYLHRSRWLPICYTFLAAFYMIAFNAYTGHHYHGMVGLVLIGIPFWFRTQTSYRLAWDGVRYYFLFIFSSAALWKISRGSVFEVEQMSRILKSQHLAFLHQQPHSLQAEWISEWISDPALSHWMLLAAVVLQLTFLVGFFTKRWDWILFIVALLFHLSNFAVMRIFSVELLILNLVLLPKSWN